MSRPCTCRQCGKEAPPLPQAGGKGMPDGWYGLTRRSTHAQYPYVRLGIYCSVRCLTDAAPVLAASERHADAFRSKALKAASR